MKRAVIGAVAALGIALASAGAAAPVLKPADPQPGSLKSGLAVSYGYVPEGQHIKSLADAASALGKGAEAGKPLTGLDYRDTTEGDKTLTSKAAFNVAADIRGYVRFDAPGTYQIEFLTNDGLNASIGGQQVGYFDGRQPCESTRVVEVEVPQAGWYPLKALYFQRLGTACLHMRWAPPGGKMTWVPDSAFGH